MKENFINLNSLVVTLCSTATSVEEIVNSVARIFKIDLMHYDVDHKHHGFFHGNSERAKKLTPIACRLFGAFLQSDNFKAVECMKQMEQALTANNEWQHEETGEIIRSFCHKIEVHADHVTHTLNSYAAKKMLDTMGVLKSGESSKDGGINNIMSTIVWPDVDYSHNIKSKIIVLWQLRRNLTIAVVNSAGVENARGRLTALYEFFNNEKDDGLTIAAGISKSPAEVVTMDYNAITYGIEARRAICRLMGKQFPETGNIR